MINDVKKDLNIFYIKRLKRLLQKCKIWLDVNKIYGRYAQGRSWPFRVKKEEFDKTYKLKHKLIKFRGLCEILKIYGPCLGPKIKNFWLSSNKNDSNASPIRVLQKKLLGHKKNCNWAKSSLMGLKLSLKDEFLVN